MVDSYFESMSLARRLGLGFISVLALLLAVAFTSSYALKLQGERVQRIVQVNNVKTALANDLMDSINELAIRSRSAALFTDMDRKQLQLEFNAANSALASFLKTEQALNAILEGEDPTGTERALMADVLVAQKTVFAETAESLKQALDADTVAAVLTLSNRVRPAEVVLRAKVTGLIALQSKTNQDASRDVLALQQTVFFAIGCLVAVALATGGLIAWRITRSVTTPITRMQVMMTEIASSQDFSRRVPVDRMDEIGLSLVAFNTMIEKIQESTVMQGRAMTLAEQMTAELRVSEQNQRAILENASIGIIFTSRRITIHSNSKASALFGWESPAEMQGLPGSVYWPSAAEYEEVGRSASAGLATGVIFETERPMRRKDGSQFLAHIIAKAIDPNAVAAGTIWIIQDVTEQRRVEHLLQDSERHLSQIIGGSPIAMFVIDQQHRVSHWNLACERLTGVPAAAVIGSTDAWRGFYDSQRPTMANLLVDGQDDDEISRHYADRVLPSQLIPGAVESEGYLAKLMPNGRWLHSMAAPLRDSRGSVIGAIETISDLTERKAAEELLAKRTDDVQQANAELGQAMQTLKQTQQELVSSEKLAALGALVNGVSHELNTPLGNGLIALSYLRDELQSFKDETASSGLKRQAFDAFLGTVDSSLSIALRSMDRCVRLVNSFKKVAVDRASRRDQFLLASVVNNVLGEFKPKLQQTGYRLITTATPDVQMDTFSDALMEVLKCLLDNALSHGLVGREAGRITVLCEQQPEAHICISVRDDGHGILPEHASKVFDPFFTTRMGQGTGLGLHIAHNMVTQLLGGTLTVDSTPQEGSVFVLLIPITAP